MLASARPSSLGKAGRRLRLLEALPQVRRTQHLHAEERIAARGIDSGVAARVDQRRVHGDAGPERPAQRELRRGFAASATNTPFLVPIVRITRSRHVNLLRPRQDRDHVPARQRRVDPVEVAHVSRIHEHVQVPAHRAGFVTDIAIERGLGPFELRSAARTVRAETGSRRRPRSTSAAPSADGWSRSRRASYCFSRHGADADAKNAVAGDPPG